MLLVVVRVVPRVQHVVLDRVWMVGQRLEMVRPDKPLRLRFLGWQGTHDVLLIVVSGEV